MRNRLMGARYANEVARNRVKIVPNFVKIGGYRNIVMRNQVRVARNSVAVARNLVEVARYLHPGSRYARRNPQPAEPNIEVYSGNGGS
jgi:hypothetical protein